MSIEETPPNAAPQPAAAAPAQDAGSGLTPATAAVPAEPALPDAGAPAAARDGVAEPPAGPSAESAAESAAEVAPEVAPEAPAEGPADPAAPAAAAERGLSPAQTAVRLAELFPALFSGPPKPIKLRIQADIQARAPGVFTKRVLSFFLSRHTTTTPYLKALVAGPHRFDLDGQPAGEIAAEHQQAAVEELARRRQIVEARRAAERAARPPRPAAAETDAPGPRAARPPRGDRPPRGPDRDRPAGDARPARPMRPGRPERPAADRRPAARGPDTAAPRPPRPSRPDTGRAPQPASSERAAAAQPLPADPARRERAFLLRAWETSSLTKANFCALKRLTEAEFDAQLELARQERAGTRTA